MTVSGGTLSVTNTPIQTLVLQTSTLYSFKAKPWEKKCILSYPLFHQVGECSGEEIFVNAREQASGLCKPLTHSIWTAKQIFYFLQIFKFIFPFLRPITTIAM